MQKVLRVFSIIAFFFAVCVVIALSVTLYNGDLEIESFLDKPGIVERLRTSEEIETNTKILSPLVHQSIAMALRLNRPEMPDLTIRVNSITEPVVTTISSKAPSKETEILVLPPVENIQFKLVGTAVCVDRPDRSLALIQLSNGKLEWFYQGEHLGRFYVDDIRDGSTTMIRGSEKTELSVPPKPYVRKLLKNSGDSI